MASVLTPYRSSDGNNPYTEAQLRALWNSIEPSARAPGKYSATEKILLQREFLTYIQQGFTPTRAVSRLQALATREPEKWPFADYATFMAWKAYDTDFSDAWEVAYAMGTDALEDKAIEMSYGGNASMLQFVLKMRNPQRYGPKGIDSGQGALPQEVIHRIEIVAARPQVLEIEDQSQIVDAEVIDDNG